MKSMLLKIVLKAASMLIIFLGISSYSMYLLTGQLPFGFNTSDIPNVEIPFRDQIVNLKSSLSQDQHGNQVVQTESGKVYKWQDPNGDWHYGDTPPEGQQAITSLDIDPNQNLIQGVNNPQAATSSKPAPKTTTAHLPSGSAYAPDQIKQLFEDAQGLQEKLNTRAEQQQQVLR